MHSAVTCKASKPRTCSKYAKTAFMFSFLFLFTHTSGCTLCMLRTAGAAVSFWEGEGVPQQIYGRVPSLNIWD